MPLYVHHDMVAVPSTIKPKSPPKLEDSLHWLASVISANRTLTLPTGVFKIGKSSLNLPTGDKCPKNPQGGEGTCTLIKDCPEVFTLLTDFDTYKQYFCPVQNKFAGVCCPKKKTS
ncbi:unnamed protein product [Psylliodes chrysocephalus]|uniref:Clip domain-containing protein n=1 Tax=Psylliodes chrysocephalus TaxID=3402493 RepID=A0A9P0DCD0_9CUCU|nr:unnamed protein product [Psylliodes chrysocephala]